MIKQFKVNLSHCAKSAHLRMAFLSFYALINRGPILHVIETIIIQVHVSDFPK